MFKKIRDWIAATFFPLRAIADELKILRELYELELATRHVYRITETPGKKDTEVFFSEEEIPMKGALHKAMANLMGVERDDDEYEEEDDEPVVDWPTV